ncbi:MAG: deoxyribose-phosphate aldolase [Vicingus serpentipes]|nr:deoxyribose-phosphate aldolase [Vicingus serpentipes]
MISITNIKDIPSLSASFHFKEDYSAEINAIHSTKNSFNDSLSTLTLLFSLLDLTSLEGSDNNTKIERLCDKVLALDAVPDIPSIAAICVYSPFGKLVANKLKNTSIQTACVAGAFPSGQSPIEIKLQEIEWIIQQGVTEIDVVISRGKLIAGYYQEVFNEMIAIRSVAKNVTLKVIIESGELQTAKNIRIASDIAMYAGADFIKTSTGKIAEGATYPTVYIMLHAIKDFHKATGRKVGLKPAGGISTVEIARNYLILTEQILGRKWINNQLLRFGASQLANTILYQLATPLNNPQLINYFKNE